MLDSTFCHMPGVGPKTERRLWGAGVTSWRAATEPGAVPLPGRWPELVARHAARSIERLAARDAAYFYGGLPSAEQWRMFPEFRDSVAYLDIETTGLGGYGDHVTCVSLYDGSSLRWYVHDENLDDFRDDVEQYRVIVTYNGKTFDFPFLRNALGLPMSQAHIDLRYVLHSLGIKGGLKGSERALGMSRGELEGVDGYFAVALWHDWRANGNRRALDTLLAYNVTDTVNLERLMAAAYNLKVRGTAFEADRTLELPEPPPMPFEPDAETIARIRRELGWTSG